MTLVGHGDGSFVPRKLGQKNRPRVPNYDKIFGALLVRRLCIIYLIKQKTGILYPEDREKEVEFMKKRIENNSGRYTSCLNQKTH